MLNRDEPMTAENIFTYNYSLHQESTATYAKCTMLVLGVPIADVNERIGDGFFGAWTDSRELEITLATLDDDLKVRLAASARDVGRFKMIELQHAFSLVEDL